MKVSSSSAKSVAVWDTILDDVICLHMKPVESFKYECTSLRRMELQYYKPIRTFHSIPTW